MGKYHGDPRVHAAGGRREVIDAQVEEEPMLDDEAVLHGYGYCFVRVGARGEYLDLSSFSQAPLRCSLVNGAVRVARLKVEEDGHE
ncbi:hypothetical protein KJZ99_00120 [bacterium]|nr:hypothetical protein [bacterium]